MRFWALILLTGCGAAAPEAPLVEISTIEAPSEASPPPTGMPAPFDLDRPVTVYRVAKGAGVTGLPPDFPPELRELAHQTMRQLAGSGMLPQGLDVAPVAGPPLEPAWTEAGYAVVQKRVIADPAMRAQLRRIFGRATNYQASDAACFEPSLVVTIGDGHQVAVSLPCHRAAAKGFAWPHPDDGLTNETRRWLEALHGSLFGVAPPSQESGSRSQSDSAP